MRIGIATDHGGYGLKQELVVQLRAAGHEVIDFGAQSLGLDDDYPDYVTPLARLSRQGRPSAAWPSAAAALGHLSVQTRFPASAPH
jgi:ribose 5-phosphate isomerase B